MRAPRSGGGWQAIWYTLGKGRQFGYRKLWRAMRSKNACKTCALGMGGQNGGMVNEEGRYPEFCKKSLQAMTADMQGKIEPKFFATYSLRDLATFSPREMENAGRLVHPIIASPGDTHYRPISWDDAFALIAKRIKATTPDRSFFYASGRSSNEAGFLLNLFARSFGTNHVCNCSYYCHQASGVGLYETIGSHTSTVELEDIRKSDTLFLIGGNPASNHPRFMSLLMQLRKRGGKVIVVNPLKETGLVNFRVPSNMRSLFFGSEIASLYLQPNIGGDIALFAGIAKVIVERGRMDEDYIETRTEGFEEARSLINALRWEEIEDASGLSKRDIEEAASVYLKSERTIFAWTMGVTHHEHGVQNVHWIVNLALLRGMIGKPGAGVLPIRGHSNVQGIGSVGVSPQISKIALENLQNIGIAPPQNKGYDPLSALEAAHNDELDFMLSLGGNLFGASPDAIFTEEAFSKIDTVVYLNTTLNTGHARGLGKTTLILPVLPRDEEPQSTTQESMFNYIRLSDGGPKRHSGPESEVEILSEIAYLALGASGPIDWRRLKDHDEIRGLIARILPNLSEISEIGKTKREFAIPGRVKHEPAFNTPNKKAKFIASPLPKLEPLKENQLRLMTVRSEGQFNTVVYEEEDLYRGQERRDVILMNSVDIERLNLEMNMHVDVHGPAGVLRNILVREFDIAESCAMMYYPEANVLLNRTADPKSKTPAFKSAAVSIEPVPNAPVASEESRMGQLST